MQERRGGKAGSEGATLEEKAQNVLAGMSEADLTSWIKKAQDRGDPSMLKTVMEMAEKIRGVKDSSLQISIVPYQVPDSSLPDIIDKCDVERFRELKAAVVKRVNRENERIAYQKRQKEAQEATKNGR